MKKNRSTHALRTSIDVIYVIVRKAKTIIISSTLQEIINKKLIILNLTRDMYFYRAQWK